MTISYPLLLDVILALLLVVTIWYAVVLNKRLSALRRNREEMEKLAATFHDATSRASDSIDTLKIASDALQDQLSKATSLRDDLVFLIDRGTAAADRLEDGVRGSRGAMPSGSMAGSGTDIETAAAEAEMGPEDAEADARKVASVLSELVDPKPAAQPKGRRAPALPKGDMTKGAGARGRAAAPQASVGDDDMSVRRDMFGDEAPGAAAGMVGSGDMDGGGAAGEPPRSEAERALLKAIRGAN